MAAKKWSQLSSGQQAAIIVVGSVQLALAATAWADLARRPAAEVEGGKARWAAIIAINVVGPLALLRARTQGQLKAYDVNEPACSAPARSARSRMPRSIFWLISELTADTGSTRSGDQRCG